MTSSSGINRARTLFQQNHPGKAIIQVPEVHTADAALVVKLPVHIKGLVGGNLELAYSLTWYSPVVQRRVELVAPW